MSANILPGGKVQQLERRKEPDEEVTEEQLQAPARLVRVLMTILRDVATLKRSWRPRRIDFVDKALDDSGVVLHRFPHKLRGRVRWWVVDWVPATGGTIPSLEKHVETSDMELVLISTCEGIATIRLEEAG